MIFLLNFIAQIIYNRLINSFQFICNFLFRVRCNFSFNNASKLLVSNFKEVKKEFKKIICWAIQKYF